jgi:excisionase family DNA binding protein
MKADQFYTVRMLADRLAITPLTVYRLVRQGKIPAVKIGKSIRFDPAAVHAFLESVRVGPEAMTKGSYERRKS